MPSAGSHRTSLIFLADRQARLFANPSKTEISIQDKAGATWQVVSGQLSANDENYGVFDGNSLIASLSLSGPSSADSDCPTPYWSVGMIEVASAYQGRGIGSRLLDAVFVLRGQPLASDLDQDGGGADLWRRWIRDYPGKVELHDPQGKPVVVTATGESYSPDPWAARNTRLVRKP